MCGILGIIESGDHIIDLRRARKALTLMRHRGPDDEGYLLVNLGNRSYEVCGGVDTDPRNELRDVKDYLDGHFNVVLGHRRLSILDLSSLGHQPMGDSHGRYWIVYNGEIYNYIELRKILAQRGHLFKTASDTEVILAAYKEWGTEMLSRFVGMFSFGILDIHDRALFLGRDFFGIKPLYYCVDDSRFYFSSEIKPLLELKAETRRGNAKRLYEYLAFGLSDFGSETFFADIHQLPPAHYMHIRLNALNRTVPVRYWQIDPVYRQDISFKDACKKLRNLIYDTVRIHMRSDVMVGSCLSGGLDSSAIVMNMKELAGPGQMLHTFSYIADDPTISEEKFVDMIAQSAGSLSHKTSFTSESMIADLERLLLVQEEPFMSSSIYAQHCVFKLVHDSGIKVVLDGQGADEIFAGYYNQIGARITSLLMQGRVIEAMRVLRGAPNNMRDNRSRMVLFSLMRMLPPKWLDIIVALMGLPKFPSWIDQKWFLDRGVKPHYRMYGRGTDALRKESIMAIDRLGLPQLLRYEDRNSMFYAIESRVPFCNPEIARFALSLPENYLIANDGSTKSVLREALRGIVPKPVLEREKVGFATPQKALLETQSEWAYQTFHAVKFESLPFMKKTTFEKMIKRATGANGIWSTPAWRCLISAYWSRLFKVEWE